VGGDGGITCGQAVALRRTTVEEAMTVRLADSVVTLVHHDRIMPSADAVVVAYVRLAPDRRNAAAKRIPDSPAADTD
jgi:hypothetical protein